MAIRTQVLEEGQRNVVMQFTNDDTTAGEAAVVKVDVSALNPPCARVAIEKMQWSTLGQSVYIYWDATLSDLAWRLPPDYSDTLDFREVGGLQNPKSAGWTGDVRFTVPAGAGTYSIVLWMKKKYD